MHICLLTYYYFETNTYLEQTKFVVVGLANCLTKINMVANSDYLLSNNVWLYLVSTLTMIYNGLKSILIENFLLLVCFNEKVICFSNRISFKF